MSKVILSSSLMAAHGKMGNVVFRKRGDEYIMAHVPIIEAGRVPTDKQAGHRQQFKQKLKQRFSSWTCGLPRIRWMSFE